MRNEYASKVSAMTGLPSKIIDRICELETLAILEMVYMNKDSSEPISVPIHDFGDLFIVRNEEDVKIEFRASPSFEKRIQKTLEQKSSPTIDRAEDLLIKKIMKYYKEII